MPDFSLENSFSCQPVAGVDEVGYGAWAGPVVVAAVVITSHVPQNFLACVQDSKRLSPARRQYVYDAFTAAPQWGWWAVSFVPADQIKSGNVLRLTLAAMAEAVRHVPARAVLVDGCHGIPCALPQKSFPKGDQKSFSIALASVIAKVTRDHFMSQLAPIYPLFKWDANKGYGTAAHRIAIRQYGLTPHHRPHYCHCA